MLIHLLVIIGFWFSSSAAEFGLTDSTSPRGGEGRLMKLTTCLDYSTIQCNLCEIIRVVNVSYAASPGRETNSIECSDVNAFQAFDCPGNREYLDEIAGNCNGNQTCEPLLRMAAFLYCDSLANNTSCCVEIFYVCEQRKGVILSPIYDANDPSGNVTSVSLQCQSSVLSVDSAVLAFNIPSSGEFPDGICYRSSTNKEYIVKLCNGAGCSNVQVPIETGCGGDTQIQNYGVYIYYICDHSPQNQCQRPVEIPTVQSTNTWPISTVLLVIGVAVLVVAVVASFVVGFLVGRKRRRKMFRELQTRAADQKMSSCVTRETPGGKVSQGELERHTYQEISSSIIMQDDILENSLYCEIQDVEIIVKQERTEPGSGRENRATRKTDELADIMRVNDAYHAYTEPPGKLESKQTMDDIDTGGISSTAVYALVTHPIPDPKLVYDEVNQSNEAQTSTSTEVDFLKQYINPVYETVDESNTHSNPDCKGPAQPKNFGKSVYSKSDTPRRDSKTLYAKINKSKTSATNT